MLCTLFCSAKRVGKKEEENWKISSVGVIRVLGKSSVRSNYTGFLNLVLQCYGQNDLKQQRLSPLNKHLEYF